MSKAIITGVYDIASQIFMGVQYANNERDAKFGFEQACKNNKTMIGQFPADHTLKKLADIDLETGKITSCELKDLANGAQFLNNDDSQT